LVPVREKRGGRDTRLQCEPCANRSHCQYKLRELISQRLPITELNYAFDLMLQGEVKRSVIAYESQSPHVRAERDR
jgi:hypothetical protein